MSKPPDIRPPMAEQLQESQGPSRAPRRRYSRRKKLEILAELDRCRDGTETDAVLAREGLHGSQISLWRKGLARSPSSESGRRTRKVRVDPAQRAVELAQENTRLRRELSRVLKAMALLARGKGSTQAMMLGASLVMACW